jgi:hypothetical protein
MGKTCNILINKFLRTLNVGSAILLFIISNQLLFSQQSVEKIDNIDAKNFYEELYLLTDRDIYICGEEVWFKVYKMNGIDHSPCDISKVAYIELLDKNNFPVIQIKLKCDGNSGSSVLTLPDNISSGNYLLRAYTNWMKNYPVDLFFYKEITVINPFENITNINLPSVNQTQKDPISVDQNQSPVKDNNDRFKITVTIEKPEYSRRENVRIGIHASDMTGKPVEADLTVGVVKKGILSSNAENTFDGPFTKYSLDGIVPMNTDNPRYIPELEEHIISGIIRSKGTGEPLKKIDLSLSFVGKSARNQFGRTDNNGEFYFLIKQSGQNEIVIQPLSSDITAYYVELNQPFSDKFSSIRATPLIIDSSKIEAINNAVIGMQVYNIYKPFRKKSTAALKTDSPDFFGKPENTIKMSDYIELTSVREVVKEIIPNVYTLRQNGKYDFKLINKFRGQPFENKPLVLVDGVPVYDFEKVLNINSKEIEKADVINTRYFFSENVFDGIISFITLKGDLSVLQFDNSVFRQVYEGCQTKVNFYLPDYSQDSVRNSHLPDFRNTLYWNPEVYTLKDGQAETLFFTSDESAEYIITVEGISPEGKRGYSTARFIVK